MVDQPNPRMIMRGGMLLPEEMVRSNTPFIPTRQQENQNITSQAVGVQPLSKRMSAAYDKFIQKVEPEKGIKGKDAVALGRLLLEIEQVKNNLNSIAQEVTNANRKKAELDAKENEILEEEQDRLVALGASFRNFRRTAGAIAAALSGKQFLEGDVQGGFQNAALAVTAFLPEIIKVVSTVVLGRMLLSGRGMGAARGVASGGGRGGLLPMLLAGGGLLAAGSALGSRGSGDQRRLELTKRQAIPQLLSRNDVRRFRSSSARFDNILTGLSGNNNLAFRTNTALAVDTEDEIEEPKGFFDTAKDFGGGVLDFFRGDGDNKEDKDDENSDIASNTEEIDLSKSIAFLQSGKEFIVAPGSDFIDGEINSDFINDAEDSGGNIISVGGEDKQISNNTTEFPASSNVYVNPTFHDNSKISYILEYGAGAVI